MTTQPDLPCRDFVELVTDYLEGTLPPDLTVSIEAHLEICDDCSLYLGQMRLTVHALRRRMDNRPSAALRERILGDFRRTGS